MQVAHTIADCRTLRRSLGPVAFVPTMGALHAGHLSLIEHARSLAPHVAVSIFVNPTQFGPREDFNRYPRPIESDLDKCRAAGADLVFNPPPEDIYRPDEPVVLVDIPEYTEPLEGKHRPGHFRGVCQVVAKLFNIVSPDFALFGQKDYQQLTVLRAMTAALDFPITVVGCPTLREPDGLAMSSRNAYLTPDERERALSISRGLFLAQREFDAGSRQANRLVTLVLNTLKDPGQLGRVHVSIEYVAAVDAATLAPVQNIEKATVIAVAARVGNTRLIDNVILTP